MERNLMAPDEFKNLGFSEDEVDKRDESRKNGDAKAEGDK
jgi:hypothetical protein